jgi:hypothetical protein
MTTESLRSTASDYHVLRGLLAVPGGCMAIVAAAGNAHWGPLRHDWVFLAAALVLALSAVLINWYYNEHFGRVTPSPAQQRRGAAAAVLGVVLMLPVATLLRSQASWSLDLPVNAIAATFGLLMLGYYAATVRLRTHHLVIWGSMVVVGLAPVWTGDDPSNTGLLLAGLALIANGLLDHRELVRSLAPPAVINAGAGHGGE